MSEDAAEAARAAVQAFYDAWNAGDIEAVRATLNYPHVTWGPGEAAVRNGPDEFESPYDRLRTEGWHHSAIDSSTVIWHTSDRALCEIEYGRFREDGTRYRSGNMIYGVTEQDGHWGIQFRTRGAVTLWDEDPKST